MLISGSMLSGFVLPFIFSFSLVFGLMEIAGILKNRWAEIFIALSIAGFGVSNPQTVEFINTFMPIGLIGSIVIFSIYLAYIVIYEKMAKGKNNEKTEGIIGVLFLSLIVSLESPALWKMLPNTRMFSRSDILFAAGIAGIVLMFLWAYRLGFDENQDGGHH